MAQRISYPLRSREAANIPSVYEVNEWVGSLQ